MGVTKIATCCYCGTKAALVLKGRERHELACGNCGAPLRAMKMLPATPERHATPVKPAKAKYSQPRPKKRKKSKPRRKQMISRIWDVIEDVVDEVFD